ncbi:MAG TPA: methyltransferase domain-containing protein, partial [Dehalococcoidia bacterium]|nr:methyltransferase domain-containing protein [Dehalococcoidia bacterium]
GVDRSWPGFDAVTCVNLLDRTEDPQLLLDEVARVTRSGARLVLTTPLNWRQADGRQWDAIRDLDGLRRAVQLTGFEVELAFDGLVYREILDSRGSATDWQVAVVSARRATST